MAIQSFGYGTDVGISRKRNEDNFCVAPEIGLWAVADGMGGYEGGKTASRITVNQLAKDIVNGLALSESIVNIHRVILETASSDPNIKGMGSTVVAMLTSSFKYEIAWVGDSRAYLWDGKALRQITKDHSYVQYLLDEGIINYAEVSNHPSRHVITQALGAESMEGVDVEVVSGVMKKNEKILLCSDGLTSEVNDERIAQILKQGESPQAVVDSLISEARKSGGSDNITVILVAAPDDDNMTGQSNHNHLEETMKSIR